MRFLILIGALLLLTADMAVARESLAYRTVLSGVEQGDLRHAIAQQSWLMSLQDRPPPDLLALRRRADDDRGRILSVLRAWGYYAGTVHIAVNGAPRPAAVAIRVDPGPLFRLGAYEIQYEGPGRLPPPPVLSVLGLARGDPAATRSVIAAQQVLLHYLAERGYPLARVASRRVVVDMENHRMRVHLVVALDREARFGPVTITGLKHVDERWVRNRIPWRPGQRFSIGAVETLRKRLLDSRLFSSVRISTAKKVLADGALPVALDVTEAKPHSIGFGGSWSSTEGLGGEAFWEDRNLWGGAQRLRAKVAGSQTRNAVELDLTLPDVLRRDQDLISAVKAETQRTSAFISQTEGGSVGLSRMLGLNWRISLSAAYERTLETQIGAHYNVSLFSLPLELRHDSSNNPLDPTAGDRITLTAQPYFSLIGNHTAFQRLDLYATKYVKVWDAPRVVLAGWTRDGTILGASDFAVPPDKRLYVGGAGSVRGFGYQMAGPVTDGGTPLGGDSAVAFGGEIRMRATRTVGVVPFIEAGRAYATSAPDFHLPLFSGAGIGLRYYTPVGPVRADLAFPLDPRSGIDKRFQIYLSLGQAF